MDFKEVFRWDETNDSVLSEKLFEKEQIEKAKQNILASQESDSLSKIRSRVIESGVLDVMSEALDYLPECRFLMREEEHASDPGISISLIWDEEGDNRKDLIIYLPFSSENITIFSAPFHVIVDHPAGGFHKVPCFTVELVPEQWEKADRVIAGVADAVFKAGGKTPKTLI